MPKYRNSLNRDGKESDPLLSRRSFLALVGAFFGLGFLNLFTGSFLGFLYPNAMKIPPSVFSIGRPEELLAREGKVFVPSQKVFVETFAGKVRVQTAVCTHLGCTVNMVETGYKCPCHGSTYDRLGKNTGGPAPSPLTFFSLYKGPSGDILANKAQPIADPEQAWLTLV